ncbi:MAG TPA: HAD family phosphatase, partial [Lachnospiraceae bacterium]|nr:HAD family phosphatase [Lachnospiraceae bacterium]
MEFRYMIFDMDGTLLDSIPYWERLARNYMEDLQVTVPDDLDERLTAMSVHEAGYWLKETYSLDKAP